MTLDDFLGVELCQCDGGSEEDFVAFIEETVKYPQNGLEGIDVYLYGNDLNEGQATFA